MRTTARCHTHAVSSDRPAAHVQGSRVLIRRHHPDDAAALHAAISDSVDHLRPWMPWAKLEPLQLSARQTLIAEWIERWDAGDDFNYAIVEAGTLVGGCGLHRRVGPLGLEIGYWTRSNAIGRGVATDAARCLVKAAFDMAGIDCVEIHHDIANIASGRIPARLGFTLMDEHEDGIVAPGERGVERVWRLERSAVKNPT